MVVILFQSTLPYGSDCSKRENFEAPADFNPRSLTGATCVLSCSDWPIFNFNPRSLTGATRESVKAMSLASISIHAPLRERRSAVAQIGIVAIISIHAPLRERLLKNSTLSRFSIFQSTLPYGSDAVESAQNAATSEFQSTLPYGSDHKRLRVSLI